MSVGVMIGGRYELRAPLGRGGFGAVWRGHDITLRRDVAVKVISFAQMTPYDRDAAMRRFWREAQSVAALNHPNVVTAHDFGVHGESAFLVMELLSGGSLADELAHRRLVGAGPAHASRVVAIAAQICAGLAAAHATGVIHRDLKPANIMTTLPTGLIKIVDFGIARDDDGVRLTQAGDYLGTLPYASPEQMQPGPIDGRADLYSLACVLYELLTDRSPFVADSPLEWIEAHRESEPYPLRKLMPAVPAGLAMLIHQMLAKRPQDRPAGAGEVGARLIALDRQMNAATATGTGVARVPTRGAVHVPSGTTPDRPVPDAAVPVPAAPDVPADVAPAPGSPSPGRAGADRAPSTPDGPVRRALDDLAALAFPAGDPVSPAPGGPVPTSPAPDGGHAANGGREPFQTGPVTPNATAPDIAPGQRRPAGPTVVGAAGPMPAGPAADRAGPMSVSPAGPTAADRAGPTSVSPAGPIAADRAGPPGAGPAWPNAAPGARPHQPPPRTLAPTRIAPAPLGPYPPPFPQPPVARNPLATAGLVCGILPLPLFGLVFGLVGISRARRNGGYGRTRAIVGVVLALVWAVPLTIGGADVPRPAVPLPGPGLQAAASATTQLDSSLKADTGDQRAIVVDLRLALDQYTAAAAKARHPQTATDIRAITADLRSLITLAQAGRAPGPALQQRFIADGNALKADCS